MRKRAEMPDMDELANVRSSLMGQFSGPVDNVQPDTHDEYLKVWSHMKSVFGVQKALRRVQHVAAADLIEGDDEDDSPGGSVVSAKLDSEEVKQSVLFAQNEINEERMMVCPQGKQLKLTVKDAKTQVIDGVVVDFSFTVTGSAAMHKASVAWTATGVSDGTENVALGLVKKKFPHLMGTKAKLTLAAAACTLDDTVKVTPGEEFSAFRSSDDDQYYLGVILEQEMKEYKAMGYTKENNTKVNVPGSFSWKSEKARCLDYVHDQGKCGSCYMFASIDSLADRHCIKPASDQALGDYHHLSEMQALLCEPTGRQCSGGWASTGFEYAKSGLDTESAWGYEVGCLSKTVCKFGDTCTSLESEAAHKCTGKDAFFSVTEAEAIETYGDAAKIAKRKCKEAFRNAGVDSKASAQTCAEWVVDRFLTVGQSNVFAPTSLFCATLAKDIKSLDAATSSLLEKGQDVRSLSLDGTLQRKNSPPRRRRNCDKNRCSTQARPHGLTHYHAVSMDFNAIKNEIYKDGPIYWSFAVREDFKWFFNNWKSDAYNHQWGGEQGGHAVVAIGWFQNCQYHNGDSLMDQRPALLAIAEDDPAVWRTKPTSIHRRIDQLADKTEHDAALAEAVRVYLTGSETGGTSEQQPLRSLITSRAKQYPSGLPIKHAMALDQAVSRKGDDTRRRRRGAQGDCLYMRNSWGSGWGDGGYFRVLGSNMGGVGWSAFAGDGPK